MAKKLTNAAAGKFGLAYWYSDFYYHAALMNAFGGGVFDRPQADGQLPPQRQVGRLPDEVVDQGKFIPAEPSTALITSLFNEGKAAMVFSGPWFLGEDRRRSRYGLAPLPTVAEAGGKPLRPWITVEGVYIAAPSKNKDAAYEFVKYLTDVAGRQGPGARRAAEPGQQGGLQRSAGRGRPDPQGVPASRSTSPCRCPTCPR